MQSISEAKVAAFLRERVVPTHSLPSVQVMLERASLCAGTEYQRWADEALSLAMAFHQAAALDRLAELAMRDPDEALAQVESAKSDLNFLRACVVIEAARNFKAKADAQQRAAKRLQREVVSKGAVSTLVSTAVATAVATKRAPAKRRQRAGGGVRVPGD